MSSIMGVREYAMIKAAALKGWLNEQRRHDGMHDKSFKRAGANLIATYFAKKRRGTLPQEEPVN